MCGIAGLAGTTTRGDIGPVCTAMRDAMTHRGPDDAGLYISDHRRAALGVRRLSILDLSPTGHMPMLSQDGRVAIVQNGEIYNFKELRADLEARGHRFRSSGDTEIILALYLEYGPEFLRRLNGMFALAIWDERSGTLLLARDRLGKKPLAYAMRPDGSIAFASELQGLLCLPELERRVDLGALDYYLRFGYVPAPRSAFLGVAKLPPAHRLLWRDGTSRVEPYWQLPVPAPRAIETGQAVEEFRELFTDCVSRRLLSDVPLGAFLSGGIDSASVVATMADLSDRPVETFSIGFGEQTFDELPGARLVADRYRTNHHEFVVEPRAAEVLPLLARHYGEPYADSSALPTYYLAQVTRQHVTVALNGDGGDELLAGYDRYRAAAMLDRVETLLPLTGGAARAVATRLPDGRDLRSPISRARRFLTGFAEPAGARYSRWMSQFQPERLDQCISDELRLAWQGSGAPDYLAAPIDRRNGTGIVDTLTRLDQSTYLPEDLLVKVDIASMANSLEARSPFLDYRLFEWAATLPTSLRLNGEVSKYVLRLAMAEKLPPSTLRGPKRGFGVPVASWLRTDLRPLLEDAVLAPRALQRGYFHPGELRRLVAEHVTGRADHSKPLWALLMLELWHQQLADRPASAAVAV